jgi:hypothetical protein
MNSGISSFGPAFSYAFRCTRYSHIFSTTAPLLRSQCQHACIMIVMAYLSFTGQVFCRASKNPA